MTSPSTTSRDQADAAAAAQNSTATSVAPFEPRQHQATEDSRASSGSPEPRTSLDKDASEEHASRKREREASLEPSANPSPSQAPGATDSLPLKKNRLQNESGTSMPSSSIPEKVAEEAEATEEAHEEAKKADETEKVGQIRRKVQDLTWKEGQEADAVQQDKVDVVSSKSAEDNVSTANKTNADEAKPETSSSAGANPAPTRTQPTFSSFSAKTSPFSSVPTSSGSSSASGKSGFAGASPFAAFAKGSSSPFSSAGGMKPSSLGSSIGGSHEAASTASSIKPSSTSGSSMLKGGFGAFAGASPLTKPTSTKQDSPAAEENGDKAAQGKSFSEQLLSETSFNVAHDGLPALGATEQEVVTGEEDEETVHSVRAKLYTMGENHSWKERGTGTIRVNVPKTRDGKHSARLVMRADGVLRLILNVSLFPGMKCELQEKFVRIVAFENGQLAHFAIKMSNPNNATAFLDAVQKQIAKLAP